MDRKCPVYPSSLGNTSACPAPAEREEGRGERKLGEKGEGRMNERMNEPKSSFNFQLRGSTYPQNKNPLSTFHFLLPCGKNKISPQTLNQPQRQPIWKKWPSTEREGRVVRRVCQLRPQHLAGQSCQAQHGLAANSSATSSSNIWSVKAPNQNENLISVVKKDKCLVKSNHNQ